MRHRVEAATITNDALLADLEAHAHDEMSRGAWSSAVSSLIAASRLTPVPADRERLALEAIEAMLYSGDGAAARRLAEQTGFAEGPRRDSVLAYLAMFAGDVDAAERLLTRAWERRALVDDARLSATIAQRSAFLATARLRGREAIEWAQRAMALAPDDPATGLLVAPSLALGLSFIGSPSRRACRARPLARGSGGAATRSRLRPARPQGLPAPRRRRRAAARARRSRPRPPRASNAACSSSPRCRSRASTRAEYLAGAWDSAVVASERAIALAVESEDRWVIALAHWSASYVPSARGDWPVAEAHVRAIQEQSPTFERHIAAEAIATAGLAAARDRPLDVLCSARAARSHRAARRSGRPGVPALAAPQGARARRHRRARRGRGVHRCRERAGDRPRRTRCSPPGWPMRAAGSTSRGTTSSARRPRSGRRMRTSSRSECRTSRRSSNCRKVSCCVDRASGARPRRRFSPPTGGSAELGAQSALQRCETEFAACGLAPAARKSRDYTTLTPQELAVARLVVSGMTNREVSEQLMVSTKTVEFHLEPRVRQARRADAVRAARASARERARAVTVARR